MPVWGIILIFIAGTGVAAFAAGAYIREKDRRKLEYMLDAFEDEEYNFRFSEKNRFNKALNRIKWIMERRRQQNEQESWTKLIRVLTHEIMNTVSPIASLSDALSHSVDLPEELRETDVKAGLKTISSSSKDLIRFVESYRELAGISRPVKKGLMVDNLAHKVIDLTLRQCAEAGAVCSYRASSEDILIYADESQIVRILINLVKNAVQAGAKHIDISASIDRSEQTLIKVSNDGTPITPEAREQIFIPFFTTKHDGSGIGLSLSRQIMRAHNGLLELTGSDDRSTEFTLLFR